MLALRRLEDRAREPHGGGARKHAFDLVAGFRAPR
jgi:hypothetical protein